MTFEQQEKQQQEKMKARAEQEARNAKLMQEQSGAGAIGGYAAISSNARRPSLRERVARQAEDAHYSAEKAARLSELHELLIRNADVARILELMEDVRG
jgi:hypothetical protein